MAIAAMTAARARRDDPAGGATKILGGWMGGLGDRGTAVLLGRLEIPAAHPGVEVGARGVYGAHAVVEVAVDGHALALLPALDGGHVAFEVGRDLFP